MTEEQSLRFRTNLAILIAILAGLAVAVLHGGVVTVSIAAFGAAIGVGGVLGFLFGVPGSARTINNIGSAETISIGPGSHSTTATGIKPPPSGDTGGSTPPVDAPSEGAASQAAPASDADVQVTSGEEPVPPPSPSANQSPAQAPPVAASNLEQVADWVTKLLLGGGLTQMQRIPPKIWQWSGLVAVGILRNNSGASEAVVQAHQAFAAGLLVYGFIVAFSRAFSSPSFSSARQFQADSDFCGQVSIVR